MRPGTVNASTTTHSSATVPNPITNSLPPTPAISTTSKGIKNGQHKLNPEAPCFTPAAQSPKARPQYQNSNKHPTNNIHIWYQNVRSLLRKECLDTYKEIINGSIPPPGQNTNHSPDIICFTETWLKTPSQTTKSTSRATMY